MSLQKTNVLAPASNAADTPDPWVPSPEVLKFVIAVVFAGAVAMLTVLLAFVPDQRERLLSPALLAVLAMVTWLALRRCGVPVALNLLTYGAWVTITVLVYTTGGLQAMGVIAYPVAVILVCWLSGVRAALIMAAMTAVVIFALALAQSSGVVFVIPPTPALLRGAMQLVVLLLSVALATHFLRGHQASLAALRRVDRDLAHRTADLEATRADLNRAQAVAGIGSWVYELAHDGMRLSDETCRIFALPNGTIGRWQAFQTRVHPDDRDAMESVWQETLKGTELNHEHRILTADGVRWVCQKALMQFAADGTPLRAVGTTQDITERKQTQTALQESKDFLRTVIDEIPDPVIMKDHKGDFLLCNKTVAQLYNADPEAMVGKNDGDFGVSRAMSDSFRDNVLAIMARGETEIVYEDSRDAVSGELRHFRSIKKPLKSRAGEKQILVIAQDITDVVQAQAKVAESERRLQHVLEITREGVWDWHLPSGKVSHNSQWYRTLNAVVGDIAETVEGFSAVVYPDDRPLVWRRLEDMLQGKSEAYHSEHRLLRKDGTPIWVQDRGRIVERDAQGLPVRVIGSFSDITSQKEHQQQLEHASQYDALTNLPNRVLLADRMQLAMVQSQRSGQSLAVVYLDLDGFKVINDLYSHDAGDTLLVTLAQRMKSALREGDTLARLGGDEFVAVLVGLDQPKDCEPMLARLLQAAAAPVEIDAQLLHVSASIGATLYPQDSADADMLLRHADQAMYQAKQAGKNRFHLFDLAHDVAINARLEHLTRMMQALQQDEFVLHYQPKVNMKSGQVVGAEALIRWQHPQLGLLPPAAFLPKIEGLPFSTLLGEWVITSALKQMALWQAGGLCLPVGVNIGAHQLQGDRFPQRLAALLAEHPGVNPCQLDLEVLETSALQDLDQASETMKACRSLGVTFSLDDFGTGYSSLTHLRRLPAMTLKIDQSFVRDMLDDPEDLAIVKGVVGLAFNFHRQVIAEGVETTAHGTQLLALGCELAQGYGIARPMPAADLPAWVAHWQPDAGWTQG